MTAASAASPRTAQDIKNEFARKVMLAKTSGESVNTTRAPLQQMENQARSKQPEVQKPSQQQQRSGYQNPVHGDGTWGEKHAEDLRKRLVQIGAPPPTSRHPTQHSATTSSGLSGYAAPQDLPTQTALESHVVKPTVAMQENQQPDSSSTKRPGPSGIVPPEAWSEW